MTELDTLAPVPESAGELAGAARVTHPVTAYLAGLAPRSRRTMLGSLDRIAGVSTDGRADAGALPWHEPTFAHTAAIRSALVERYRSVNTVNLHLAALRGVLKAAWRLGLMECEQYQRAADVAAVRGSTLPKGRALGRGEIRALFEACAADPSPAGRRDAALLAVTYGCGLRRAEVAGLRFEDLDTAESSFTVRGKGEKERAVYLAGGADAALADWLAVRGAAPGSLFLAVNKGGRLSDRGLTSQAVYNVLRKRAREAGLRAFSPHDLRRTFVGDLLDAGADVTLVQKLAGHANVTTTARYDRRPERAKKRVSELLAIPYPLRSAVKLMSGTAQPPGGEVAVECGVGGDCCQALRFGGGGRCEDSCGHVACRASWWSACS